MNVIVNQLITIIEYLDPYFEDKFYQCYNKKNINDKILDKRGIESDDLDENARFSANDIISFYHLEDYSCPDGMVEVDDGMGINCFVDSNIWYGLLF